MWWEVFPSTARHRKVASGSASLVYLHQSLTSLPVQPRWLHRDRVPWLLRNAVLTLLCAAGACGRAVTASPASGLRTAASGPENAAV